MIRLLFVFLFSWVTLAEAQDAAMPSPPSEQSVEDSATTLSREQVEARRSEIENEASLDENLKKSLLAPFDEALTLLGQAESDRAKEAEFRKARDTAPARLDALRAEIERLEAQGEAPPTRAELGLADDATVQQVQEALERQRIDANGLKLESEALQAKVAEAAARPEQVRTRLISGRDEIDSTEKAIEDAKAKYIQDPGNRKQQGLLTREEARWEALVAEAAMLEEENLTGPIRRNLVEVEQKLAALKLKRAEARVAAYQAEADALLNSQVDEASRLREEVQQLPESEMTEAVQVAIGELDSLIEEVAALTESTKRVEAQETERSERRTEVLDQAGSLRRQIEIGGVDGAFGAVMLEARQSLPTDRSSRERVRRLKREIQEARSGLFAVEQAILADESEGAAPASEILVRIEASSDRLRLDLRSGYRRLIRDLGDLDLVERQIKEESRKLRDYLAEQLFWVRSSAPVSSKTLQEIPQGASWAYGFTRLEDLGQAFRNFPAWVYLLLIVGSAALFLPKKRARAQLKEMGLKTQRISTDQYRYTVKAVFLTAFLAAATPFVIGTLGTALVLQEGATEWSYGLGLGLVSFAWFYFKANFAIEICQPGELGERHFGWNRKPLHRVVTCARLAIPVYGVFAITLRLVLSEDAGTFVDGLGRTVSLLGLVGFGWLLARLLHPRNGVMAAIYEENPDSWIGRLRKVWFAAVILVFFAMIVFLLLGFVIPVLLLLRQFEASLTAIGIGFIVYGLIIRWFDLKQRKLALEEAIEERKRRLEAAHQEREDGDGNGETASSSIKVVSHPEYVGDESGALSVEISVEEEMDLEEVEDQTRRLVGFLVGVGLLVNLGYLWTNFAPAFQILDSIKSAGGFSLADLGILIVVVAVTTSTVRNLPGLLEVAILRRLDLDVGTKTAVTTLARYGVIAIGAAVLFQHLGVDWSKFGWIAAALSVGIGFGLQEVVANFISGLIILFERPIRVGDIVTVDGIDGVVSRIQIRATTITNWDRKEFIVPNKNFVTGTVLNWTLSSSVNRIVVVVGVAYGSDTDKARQILIDAANEHPRVLDDPAPFSTFEEFQDSALKLILRCYVPDMDGRVGIISDLHTTIHERFGKAGIEISFPQQDLHLRSVDAEALSILVPRGKREAEP